MEFKYCKACGSPMNPKVYKCQKCGAKFGNTKQLKSGEKSTGSGCAGIGCLSVIVLIVVIAIKFVCTDDEKSSESEYDTPLSETSGPVTNDLGVNQKVDKPLDTVRKQESLTEENENLRGKSQYDTLSVATRKYIFTESWRIERQSLADARSKIDDYYEHTHPIGTELELTKLIYLMPTWNPKGSEEVFDATSKQITLSIGDIVTIKKIERDKGTLWYGVSVVTSLGSTSRNGWIIGSSLNEQLSSRDKLDSSVIEIYLDESPKEKLMKKYGITDDDLLQITMEGLKKDWPEPDDSMIH